MRGWLWIAALVSAATLALLLGSMGGGELFSPTPVLASLSQSPANFPTSLHATRQGKATFYSEENGGFETLTGIPMSDLPCQKCHAKTYADGTTVEAASYEPGCKDCHAQVGDRPSQEVCLGCHSRQGFEIGNFSDVHREMGFECTNCHTQREMHGDGTLYSSMLEPGAMDAKCENCHATLADNDSHNIHGERVDCTACHAQTLTTCYNCHFESQIAGGGKRFFKPPRTGFKLLINREGQVSTATMQTLVYQGKSFVVIAPFGAHTISKEASSACSDCHNNAALQEYAETGRITVTRWNDEEGRLIGPQGVIPVPPDWQGVLQLDFLDYTGDPADPETDATKWIFLKHGADLMQMLFGEPLTDEQMEKLQTSMGR
jgi:hypothetical protein